MWDYIKLRPVPGFGCQQINCNMGDWFVKGICIIAALATNLSGVRGNPLPSKFLGTDAEM